MHVALPVVDMQGSGGAAHWCKHCTLVRAEHVVLLRPLSSVPQPFWPLPDTELLPYLLSCLFLCLCPFVLISYSFVTIERGAKYRI